MSGFETSGCSSDISICHYFFVCRFSIHGRPREPGEQRVAAEGFPVPVPGIEGVFHCGYHSEDSYGAASWFIQRPEGNIMMDCPRYNPSLVKRIKVGCFGGGGFFARVLLLVFTG